MTFNFLFNHLVKAVPSIRNIVDYFRISAGRGACVSVAVHALLLGRHKILASDIIALYTFVMDDNNILWVT